MYICISIYIYICAHTCTNERDTRNSRCGPEGQSTKQDHIEPEQHTPKGMAVTSFCCSTASSDWLLSLVVALPHLPWPNATGRGSKGGSVTQAGRLPAFELSTLYIKIHKQQVWCYLLYKKKDNDPSLPQCSVSPPCPLEVR